MLFPPFPFISEDIAQKLALIKTLSADIPEVHYASKTTDEEGRKEADDWLQIDAGEGQQIIFSIENRQLGSWSAEQLLIYVHVYINAKIVP
jgi:hypothetical protein